MRAAVALALLTGGVVLFAPGMMARHPNLPPEMLGHWQTGAVGFADRAMILSPDSVAIVAGKEFPIQRYPIRVNRTQQHGNRQQYDMEYLTADGPLRLSILVDSDGLRLTNRADVLWTRMAPEP